jgi:hypothetical protein
MSRAWIKRWRLEAQSGLERPPELYADGGYISGPRLQRAAQEGWALMGPAKASPRRPGVDRLLSRNVHGGHHASTGLLPG